MERGDLAEILEDTLGIVEPVADFIAGPAPGNAIGDALQDTARKACDFWGNTPGAAVLSVTANIGAGSVCQPYFDNNSYDLPQVSGDTEITFDVRLFTGVGCNDASFTPTRTWPGVHTGVVFDGFNLPPTTGCPGALGRQIRWRDDQGETYVSPTDTGGNYSSNPTNITTNIVDEQLNPGNNPPPAPGPGFEFGEPPPGNLIPLFPVPDTYDDPVYGPDTPFPQVGRGTEYPPVPTPDVSPTPDSGDSGADNPTIGGTEEGLIIGAVVTVTTTPSGRFNEYAQPNGPAFCAPRCGTLYFSMKVGCDVVWSSGIEVTQRKVFIPTPGNMPAVDAVFSGWNGAIGVVTLVRQPSAEEEGENQTLCAA